jgi:hypothetical protein
MTNNLPAKPATRDQSRKVDGRVDPRVRRACDMIIREGLEWDKAALAVGLQVRSLRLALRRPAVITYLREERHHFLTLIAAKNPVWLAELRDQNVNRAAAVSAAKTINEMVGDERARATGQQTVPGLQIVITAAPLKPMPDREIVDVTPYPPRQIEHELVEQPLARNSMITLEEIEDRAPPPRDPDPVMPDAIDDEPERYRGAAEEREELLRKLEGSRLAAPSLAAAPPIRGEIGFQEPEPRGSRSPMRGRWRDRRGDGDR